MIGSAQTSDRLKGRVALVTGSGSGLGRGFALTLANAGASVLVTGRREAALADTVAAIEEAGGCARAYALDVCDAAAIPGAFDAAEAAFGLVDTVVNNAGIPDAGHATRLALEKIDAVIGTNFRAPFLVATEAARRLIAAKRRGWIVNLASIGIAHYTASTSAALYCATKSGIARLTETLAIEWAPYGINVNAIAPGFFASEMTDGMIERVGDGITRSFPRGRIGQPGDLDSTLLYLVDPASHFVTGTCITVDDAQVSR
ncbi:SDR family oxidoreductase [Sphingomonas sp. CGMCC 1.13654]|uniref:SDR family oxidoreductase n=2 Tax=Sphingomonas chungangi TaxID=2683589 RepID=A0A838L2S6_9SPHN|nr:SDR family oxidoreductase [Sphingomonas chungangi]MVW55123.1 SDR family oxidoreductase [Sphingomonas chungangi]